MLASLLAPFERSRRLALAVGVVLAGLGFAVGFTATGLDLAILLSVGLGGSGYYQLHYRSLFADIETNSFSRGFLRNFALVLTLTLLTEDAWGLGRGLLFIFAVASLFYLFTATFIVDCGPSMTGGDRGKGGSDARAGRSATESG